MGRAELTALLAPLGFTPGPVLAPLKRQRYDSVHIFYGPKGHPDGVRALEEVRSASKLLAVTLVEHVLSNPFDYAAILQAMQAVRDKHGSDYHVNASGGTRIMVMAATIHCFLHNVPLWFFGEEGDAGTLVPLRAFGALRDMGDSKSRILRELQRRGPADMGTLARRSRIAQSTLTVHVEDLLQAGLVEVTQEGRRRLVAIPKHLQQVPI